MPTWKLLIPAGALLVVTVIAVLPLGKASEIPSPKETCISFMKSMNAGDERAITELLLNDGSPEYDFFVASVRASTAANELAAAFDKTFDLKTAARHDREAIEMADEVSDADVQTEQDVAFVKFAHGQQLVLVTREGQWRIDCRRSIAVFSKRPGAAREMTDRITGEANVMRAMADQVRQQRFPTYMEARQEMARKMAALPSTPESLAKDTSSAMLFLRMVIASAELYKINHGALPPPSAGVAAFKGKDEGHPQDPFDSFHHDPWGNPWIYRNPASTAAGYDIFSCGPDGKADTADDIHASAQ